MARVTVEDCIDKVESPYELVLVAKERTTQLNSGVKPTLDRDNDKNTVIALREIATENVKVPDLTESAVYKLRKHVEQIDDRSEDDKDIGDDFENIYKGEISKSGTPILPSKRARKIPEKLQVSKEDIDQLKSSNDTFMKYKESCNFFSTKAAESLSVGVPIIVNENIKELAEYVRTNHCGVVFRELRGGGVSFSNVELSELLTKQFWSTLTKNACQAGKMFRRDSVISRYIDIYKDLLNEHQ